MLPRLKGMSAGGPEWLSATIVDVVQWGDGEPKAARCRIGRVRMPDTGDVHLASQVLGRPMFILPPTTAAQMIGALREGLSDV